MRAPDRLTLPEVFQFDGLRAMSLRHGVSRRLPALPFEGDVGHGRDTEPTAIESNRSAFLNAIGISPADLVIARQSHGAAVRVVTAADRGRGLFPNFDGFANTDAMVTSEPGVALGVVVADCVPILLYDPGKHAVGVVHAGWRGTVANIAATTIDTMAAAFGSDAADLIAGIGPSIGPCCYEVGVEVIGAWRAASNGWGEPAAIRVGTSYHFDLWTANRLTLIRRGVARRRIDDAGVCVRCGCSNYFSHRASTQGIARPGRMMLATQLDPLD